MKTLKTQMKVVLLVTALFFFQWQVKGQVTTRAWTDPNPSFSTGAKLDNSIFPVTTGKDFTDPTITYSGPYTYFTDDATLLSQYATAIDADPNATISVNIPYLGADYNCKILNKSEFEAKLFLTSNATFFLDEGTFTVSRTGFAYVNEGIQVVGATNSGESIISTVNDGVQWFVYGKKENVLFENLVFDGNNKNLKKYYFRFHNSADGTSDNFIMKKVKFRNIGNYRTYGPLGMFSTPDYSVLDFVDREYRDENMHRYFIDVTIESAKLALPGWFTSGYAVVNINSADGIYFRNLNIQANTGHQAAIHISNSMNYPGFNYGSKNIIFAETLTLPSERGIIVRSFDSRNISFPDAWRFLALNPSWDKTDGDSYAISVATYQQFENQDATSASSYITTQAYVDVNDGAYIVRGSKDRDAQLNVIKLMLAHNDANSLATLPQPIIKMIDNPSNEIGGFTVPNFGSEKVHIVALNTIDDPLQQAPMSVKYSNSTIALTAANAANVHLYNIDFSDYFKINEAISSGGNGVTNSVRETFYHDRFNNTQEELPVELLNFNAHIKGPQVNLEWQTLVEVNNDYFSLYHSTDAENWELLAKIQGAGNSTHQENYSYAHKTPSYGINYYRLQQTDYDGTKEDIALRSVRFTESENNISVFAYPNPANNNIRIKGVDSPKQIISVLNISGVEQTYAILSEGKNINIDVSGFASGLYIIHTEKGNLKFMKK